ncbi:MAG: uroporphyrin-3 C-methyltransferase [Candidatus Azotimanducaceae bacterium]|jgi:uroporphyrin-3 C-methyltransferase
MARKTPTKNSTDTQSPPVEVDENKAEIVSESPVKPAEEVEAESTELDKKLDEAFTELENKSNSAESADAGSDDVSGPQQSKEASEKKVAREKSSSNTSGKGGSGMLASFGILISILALVLAGYAVYLMYQSNAALAAARTSVKNLEAEITSQKQASDQKFEQMVDNFRQVSEQLNVAATNEDTAIVQLRQTLNTATEQLRAELKEGLSEGLGTSGEDWLLAEVEYLIRLANQRVLMEKDPKGAATLLSSADEIVEQASGIAAYKLRESLALDIANLKGVANLDTDGLFVSLSAMSAQVPKLPRKKLARDATEEFASDVADAQSYSQQFISLITNIGSRLANLVDYRRDGIAITPILPPKEEYYLRQNLILKFEMAQLALLRGDGTIYRTSLAEAKSWIALHFIAEDPITVSLISSLDAANEVEVDRVLPNISASLRAVRELLNTFHQQDARGAVK